MVDPALVAGGVAVAGAAIAAAYSYFSGNASSADIDGDGEDELEFEGTNNGFTGCNDPTEDPAYAEDPAPGTEPVVADNTGDTLTLEAAPEEVRDIEAITDVKGVGDTRADDLADAGYHTADDLYFASDEELTDVDGIGDYTVEQIREDIGSVEGESAGNSSDTDESSETDDESGGSSSTDETENPSEEDTESSTDGDSTDSQADAGDENTSNSE
jgi:predicted flap endonuclease-1-like 5' DNA nuclease